MSKHKAQKETSGVIPRSYITMCDGQRQKIKILISKTQLISGARRLNKTYEPTAIAMETIQRETRPTLSSCIALFVSLVSPEGLWVF